MMIWDDIFLEVDFWINIVSIALIVIGIYGIVFSQHLLRMVFGLGLLEAGVNILLVKAGYQKEAIAPIVTQASDTMMSNILAATAQMVDPVPQAMVLTAIVIAAGVQALALSLVIRIYKKYGTLDSHVLFLAMERDRHLSLNQKD